MPTAGGLPTGGGIPTAGGLPGSRRAASAPSADLKPGTIVREAELKLTAAGPVWDEIKIVPATPADLIGSTRRAATPPGRPADGLRRPREGAPQSFAARAAIAACAAATRAIGTRNGEQLT